MIVPAILSPPIYKYSLDYFARWRQDHVLKYNIMTMFNVFFSLLIYTKVGTVAKKYNNFNNKVDIALEARTGFNCVNIEL